MHLSIPVPSSWPVTRRRGRQVAVVPGADEPDLLLEWGALELLPDEQRRWVQATLRVDVPATAKVDIKSDDTAATRSGWPVRLVEAAVVGSDGEILERRLAAFYAFFEHAATAMFRGLSSERFEANLEQARELLCAAGPDWSGEVSALSQLWDVAPTGETRRARSKPASETVELPEPKTRVEALARAAAAAEVDPDALAKVLDEVGAAIDEGGDDVAVLELLRGRIHRALGDLDEAVAAFERAADAGEPNEATYSIGLTYAQLDQTDKAIEAWQKVADADPHDVDALYNIGLAHYTGGEFEAALEAWAKAFERAPDDFWIARKVIQAQYALQRYDDAAETRQHLLDIWRTSSDPAVQLADEFVFDQFGVGDVSVHASETLRPRDPSSYAIYTFRVEREHEHEHAGEHEHEHEHEHPKISVQIETSDYAKQRGVPYVISVIGKKGYKALGTAEKLPPYPELKASVEQLILGELSPPSKGNGAPKS